jgi:uncharacterized protein DUF932
MQQIDYISQLAPAALSTEHSDSVSKRYSFLSTASVIEALEAEKWSVVEARQAITRRGGLGRFGKHQITFAHADVLDKDLTEIPRIMLTNAHNGSSSYRLNAGIYRFICSNGLVLSDGVVQGVSIRHTNHTIEDVLAAADAFRRNSDRILAHVEDFKKIELSDSAQVEFALQAIRLRGLGGDSSHVVTADSILAPRRSEDAGNSLWRVFNRAQENLLKGGFPILRHVDGEWKSRDARAVKAIDQSSALNIGLWDLAEQFSLN